MIELMQVLPWPLRAADALLALQSEAACVVISIATPYTDNRTLARQSVREALGDLLAGYWQQPVEAIELSNRTGEALTLLSPPFTVGLSISHAPGCSLAAVHLNRAVGVDVARIDTQSFGGEYAQPEWGQLAQDYMGPDTHRQLARTAPTVRALAFAQAWCDLEAKLKCLGRGLTEWTPALGHALEGCQLIALDLPEPLRGALAFGPARQALAS